ncbi:hypothetical protein QGM71_15020 [Virgibacillus sp. C22-A2]|uniref:Uncharacterized protein n=1 Tax=Virgibacillus tibetensis TaxID=3042313 RepID=A0ABU6KI85_9BACI|nr:hypothetical protein [Virgibacillus sp. C22-A2]
MKWQKRKHYNLKAVRWSLINIRLHKQAEVTKERCYELVEVYLDQQVYKNERNKYKK